MITTMVAVVMCLFGCSPKNVDTPLSGGSELTESVPSATHSTTGTFDGPSTGKGHATTATAGNVGNDSTSSETVGAGGETTTTVGEDASVSDAPTTTTNAVGMTATSTTITTSTTTRVYENDSGWMEWIPV